MRDTYMLLRIGVLTIGTILFGANVMGQCTITPNDGGCSFDHTQLMTKSGYRLVYTNPNTNGNPVQCTFTVPNYVNNINIYVWGAGGGGGSAWSQSYSGSVEWPDSKDACAGGGGGGGGGYTEFVGLPVSGGEEFTVIVGAGGRGGALYGSPGNNSTSNELPGLTQTGGESRVIRNYDNVSIYATGGGGGYNSRARTSSGGTPRRASGTAGTGGSGYGGSTNYTGGSGTTGRTGSPDRGGAGGGGAGSSGDGKHATNGASINADVGGVLTTCHGGIGANGRSYNLTNNSSQNGNAATEVGAGGGGGLAHSQSNSAAQGSGGNGGPGLVIIEFTFPLAVTLSDFTVSCENGRVIRWTTESEKNSSYFIVERSRDGVNWDEAGRVEGSGTTLVQQKYTLEDNSASYGTFYYRLKQVDYDGKVHIYEPVISDCSVSNGIVVYPNPVENKFVIEISSETAFEGAAMVYDLNGKVLVRREVSAAKGISLVYFDDYSLAAGTYIVVIEEEDKRKFQPVKLIVR